MSNTLVRWRCYYNHGPRPAAPPGEVAVVNPVAGTTRTLPSGYVLDTARPTETVRTRNNFDYGQAAAHVSFWQNRISLLGAVRQDDWSSNSDFTDFAMDLPVGWNGREIIYRPDAPAGYYGLTYFPKNAAGAVTGARTDAAVRPRAGTGLPLPEYANDVLNWNSLQGNLANLTPADQKVSRLAEVTGNLYTDYTIQAGRLKGLRFGAGINYRGREVIGYRGGDTMVSPTNPAAAIDDPNVGPLDPVYRPVYYVTTATFGYTFRLRDRLPVRVDLTVNNALDEDVPLYYNVAQRPPGGDLANPARAAARAGRTPARSPCNSTSRRGAT